MNGPRPGGPKPGGPGNPDPRPPNSAYLADVARIAASPLITEAPPLTEAQRDRLAVLLTPSTFVTTA